VRTYTHEEYGARRYFPELDGVRAVSVLLVFTTHLDVLFWERLHGSTGVTFFFVLSGYLITTLALREEHRSGRLGLGSFYTRRVFRIYPLYVLVLGIYCVLILGLGMAGDRRDAFVHSLPYYLAFLPEQALLGWRGEEPPFSGAWSLGIEEKFYFVWPLLGFVLLAGRFRARVATLLAATVLFSFGGTFGTVGILVEPYALLALGCLAGVLLHRPAAYAVLQRLGTPPILGGLVVVLLLVQLTLDDIKLGGDLYVVYGALVTAVLVGVLTARSRPADLLSVRPLVFLGRVSYAFYLTHNFAINGVQGALPDTDVMQGIVAPALALPVAVGIAWCLHVTVERPMIRVGHRLAHRDKPWRAMPSDEPGPAQEPVRDRA
jgi:peptidoglycan/LPS O-acetylase OafA/YrhL